MIKITVYINHPVKKVILWPLTFLEMSVYYTSWALWRFPVMNSTNRGILLSLLVNTTLLYTMLFKWSITVRRYKPICVCLVYLYLCLHLDLNIKWEWFSRKHFMFWCYFSLTHKSRCSNASSVMLWPNNMQCCPALSAWT